MAHPGTRSRLAPYIDGNVHILRAADVGMCSVQSIAGAFRQACIIRGFASTVKRTGDAIAVQAVDHSQVKKRGTYRKKISPEQNPKPVASLSLLTDAYLRTPIGSEHARNTLGRMLAASRGK